MDPLRFRFRLLKSYGSCSDSGSEFLTSYGSGSGSTGQQVTVPTVPVLVPVPEHCKEQQLSYAVCNGAC